MNSSIINYIYLKYNLGTKNKLIFIFISIFITTLIISSIIIFNNKPSWVRDDKKNEINHIKLFSYSIIIALIVATFITLFIKYI